jgi:biotin carboxylase
VMLQGHSALFSPPELNLLPFTSMDERNRKLAPAVHSWMNCDQRVGLTEAVMALMGFDVNHSATWIRQFEEGRASTETMYRVLRKLSSPRRLVDKSTLNASSPMIIERSLDIDPGAKFIHLVRHPAAAIESVMRMYFADCDPLQALRLSEQLWTLPNQNIVDFCGKIPRESYLRVRYEGLVAEPDAVLHEICSFLQIQFEDALLRPYCGDRMTEGSPGNFKSLSDPNFHMHNDIDASLGMVGDAVRLPQGLGLATVELARQFCYRVVNEEPQKRARRRKAVAGNKHDPLHQHPVRKSSAGRVILVVPPYTYRAEAYLDAADALGLEAVCAIDPSCATLMLPKAHGILKVPFNNPTSAVRALVQHARTHQVSGVVSVDDGGVEIAALTAQALGFPHNPVGAIEASNDKYLMRQKLRRAGVSSPNFEIYRICENPRRIARELNYPVVLKPLHLTGSRGVIRADDPHQFTAAFARLGKILSMPGTGPDPKRIMVEDYIPGDEVSVEGILLDGKLEVLAIYDKPDPLIGPFFEETIFITPSLMTKDVQDKIIVCAQEALRAVGLRVGPVQVELRVNDHGPWIVEFAARTMGGYCSRALPFAGGATLEQLVLSRAAGLPDRQFAVQTGAHGVIMIPIPGDGVYKGVRGVDKAELVSGVTGVMISVAPNARIQPLPEGDKYVGFIFASGESPKSVERSLREAHGQLEFQIDPVVPAEVKSKCAADNKQLITMQFDAIAIGCLHATQRMVGAGRAAAL